MAMAGKPQQEDSMKYLLALLTALAFVGSATATSESGDCCPGACCLINSGCCAR